MTSPIISLLPGMRVRLTCVCGESKDLHDPLFGKVIGRSEALALLRKEDETGCEDDYWAEITEKAGLFVRLDMEEWMPEDSGRTLILSGTPHPMLFEECSCQLEDLFLVELIGESKLVILDRKERRKR